MVKRVTKDTELDTRMGIVESDNAPLKIVELPAHDAHTVAHDNGGIDNTIGQTHGRVLENRQRGQVIDSGHIGILSRVGSTCKRVSFFSFPALLA